MTIPPVSGDPLTPRFTKDAHRLLVAVLLDVMKTLAIVPQHAPRHLQRQAQQDEAWVRSDIEQSDQHFSFVFTMRQLGLDVLRVRQVLLTIRAQALAQGASE
jgi:hypothetical protein